MAFQNKTHVGTEITICSDLRSQLSSSQSDTAGVHSYVASKILGEDEVYEIDNITVS